ncbi:ankyrin repeat and SAM domain-containing protein 1A-like [Ostrinia nubilalis]|uniref:ankyrin repeat and SAM domain-containing protein 1A-like n=1 Tax=Ostrinia nubilalis TaxID=29057 RepID=UPI0030824816
MGRGQELLDAARNGERRTVEKILGQITKRSGPFTSLRRGAGVNVQDDNGYTPLHHACLNGHKEIVRMLLSVDASPCIADKRGATPLHLAAWKGESNIVAMLLAHKNPPVNVDQLTQDHETALLSAAHFGYTDVVAQLIAKGADVTIRNIRDESALDLAAQYGRLETVQHLLRVMPQLVDPYKPPKCRTKLFSSTPLHRASKNGRKEVVQALLAAGIDPNIRTHNGTPLHEAACFRKASVVRILLANGADLNATDRRGMTVHDLLADYSEEATRKVRRVIRGECTCSLLFPKLPQAYVLPHMCCRKGSVVRILLANGADLNATDRRGMTVQDLLADYSEEATRKVRRVIRGECICSLLFPKLSLVYVLPKGVNGPHPLGQWG